jgi:hypothetical protein
MVKRFELIQGDNGALAYEQGQAAAAERMASLHIVPAPEQGTATGPGSRTPLEAQETSVQSSLQPPRPQGALIIDLFVRKHLGPGWY